MQYPNIAGLARRLRSSPPKGPVAVVLAEDGVELLSTLDHLRRCGFADLIVLCGPGVALPPEAENVSPATFEPHDPDAPAGPLNAIIRALPTGCWVHYCYNGEFLHFPNCEHRSIGEMLTFHAGERRDAMLTYVVDLYADDLGGHPDGVSLERAHFDRTGYFALAREGALERQLDFFGGLRWRFEEHIPTDRRKIDRISLFRTKPGLTLRPDHTFDDPEYNTFSCPWHHNLTAAVCSFRTAKALKTNPSSKFDIPTFQWGGSEPFRWSSVQLMEHGLMEPGQWF